jgi:hypothetical protein
MRWSRLSSMTGEILPRGRVFCFPGCVFAWRLCRCCNAFAACTCPKKRLSPA